MNVWNGFPVFTSGPVSPNLWVVIAPTGSGGLAANIPQYLIDKLNGLGIFVAGVHWRGVDNGEEDFGARYFNIGSWILDMKAEYGLTANPVLYAQSRGGLQALNFACEAASLVSRVACLYPVTDPFVYPGNVPALYSASGHDAAWWSVAANKNPFTPNAKAGGVSGIPVCIWHGDSDTAVPKSATTDIFAPVAQAYVKTLAGFGHEAPSNALIDEMVGFMQWGTIPAEAAIPGVTPPPPPPTYTYPAAEVAAMDAAWAALKAKL